jgi:hypothetical protein
VLLVVGSADVLLYELLPVGSMAIVDEDSLFKALLPMKRISELTFKML